MSNKIERNALKRKAKKRLFTYNEESAIVQRVIGNISSQMEIYGITNGGFSLINLIDEIIKQIHHPVSVDISSWTIADFEIMKLSELIRGKTILNLRFLTDRSFFSRHPEKFNDLEILIGLESIRTARCHCKFCLIYNDDWSIAIRTSMNLNQNKRIENFEISDDANLLSYMKNIVDFFFETPFNLKGSSFKSRGSEKELYLNVKKNYLQF